VSANFLHFKPDERVMLLLAESFCAEKFGSNTEFWQFGPNTQKGRKWPKPAQVDLHFFTWLNRMFVSSVGKIF
jgi:hypothetical protein